MRKVLLALVLIASILEGCNKSSSPSPTVSKPKLGTTWTYRYRKFNALGSITESYYITYKAAAEQTINGEKWLAVTDSLGNIVRLLSAKADGLYQSLNSSKSLLCKDPANVGDSYISQNSSGDITYTVKEKDLIIGVPMGEVTVYRYEGVQNTLVKDMLWYNANVWIAREDFYGVNPFTMANYVMSRIELNSIKY